MSVYKVVQLVGTSSDGWEDAARTAVNRASQSLRDLRIATVDTLDVVIEDGEITTFRAKVDLSFRYEDHHADE